MLKKAIAITSVLALLGAGSVLAQPPGGGGGGGPPPMAFADIDKNKDGKITKEELAAFYAARPAVPGRPAPDADAIMGRWDTNKDGSISQAEFDARPRGPGGGGPGGPGGPGAGAGGPPKP